MTVQDFQGEPFVTVCEKDITLVGSTTVEMKECRNPADMFWIIYALIIGFIWITYKIACHVKR